MTHNERIRKLSEAGDDAASEILAQEEYYKYLMAQRLAGEVALHAALDGPSENDD